MKQCGKNRILRKKVHTKKPPPAGGVTSADPFVYPTSQHSFTLICDGCSDTTQIFLGTEECQAHFET